jgi:hypothetical protein
VEKLSPWPFTSHCGFGPMQAGLPWPPGSETWQGTHQKRCLEGLLEAGLIDTPGGALGLCYLFWIMVSHAGSSIGSPPQIWPHCCPLRCSGHLLLCLLSVEQGPIAETALAH